MTNLEGMHSYFWLTSSRLTAPVQDHVPYTTRALRQDLLRVRNAWEECQASRERDAIYIYLTAVFDLVAWWRLKVVLWNAPTRLCACRGFAHSPARSRLPQSFAARLSRQRSINGRGRNGPVLRYALRYKSHSEPLDQFIKRKGRINGCADRFTRCLERAAA